MLHISKVAWSIEHRILCKTLYGSKLQNNSQAFCPMHFYNNLEFIDRL